MSFEGFPLILGWELTLACNLRCSHCGSSAGLSRANELTLDEALAICNQFPDLLVQEVNFTGGEPLLRPDWQKIVLRLGKQQIICKILTNGLILGPTVVKQLKEMGIANVGISLDGLEATHDHIRGHKGLFRHILTGIELLMRHGLSNSVITTVNSLNLGELPLLYEFIRSSGIRRWQVQPIFPLGRALDKEGLCLSDQDYMKLGKFIQDWQPRAIKDGLEIRAGDSFGYFADWDRRDPPWRGCPAGLLSCGITSDGKIKGCLSLPDEIIEGDLRQKDLWDIWFHPDSFAYTRRFSKEELGPFCQSCEKSELCHGGCSAMSYGSTGSFRNDPYCLYGIVRRRKSNILGKRNSY